jgi:hypothetical protein
VYGGTHVGLMGMLADAVLRADGEAVGVIPERLMGREVGHKGLTKLHVLRSMHERKALMADLSDAFVALPGGFGTLEEFCEVVTWAQLGLHAKPCGILNVFGYYSPLLAMFDHAVEERFPEGRKQGASAGAGLGAGTAPSTGGVASDACREVAGSGDKMKEPMTNPRRVECLTSKCESIPMRTFTQPEPLTDGELDRLGDFLKGCKGGKAMNVETLDGFFAAFIAGPETVMPSEYYREVFGGEMSDTCEFTSLDEANEILGLMMRHWNTIAGTLFKGEVYVPLLLEDEDGTAQGNDWARGFMRAWACATMAGVSLSTTRSPADA